jgi:hypothetical protein
MKSHNIFVIVNPISALLAESIIYETKLTNNIAVILVRGEVIDVDNYSFLTESIWQERYIVDVNKINKIYEQYISAANSSYKRLIKLVKYQFIISSYLYSQGYRRFFNSSTKLFVTNLNNFSLISSLINLAYSHNSSINLYSEGINEIIDDYRVKSYSDKMIANHRFKIKVINFFLSPINVLRLGSIVINEKIITKKYALIDTKSLMISKFPVDTIYYNLSLNKRDLQNFEGKFKKKPIYLVLNAPLYEDNLVSLEEQLLILRMVKDKFGTIYIKFHPRDSLAKRELINDLGFTEIGGLDKYPAELLPTLIDAADGKYNNEFREMGDKWKNDINTLRDKLGGVMGGGLFK